MLIFLLLIGLVISLGKDFRESNQPNRKLQTCFSNCDQCSVNGLGPCTLCSVSYNLVQTVCTSVCPTGFTGSPCALSSDFIFNLTLFNEISDPVYDSQSSLPVSSGQNSNFYPNYDPNDAYATEERGYYFTGTSYMHLQSDSLIFAPLVTIYAWINPETASSAIFCKQDSSSNDIFLFGFSSNSLVLSYGGILFASLNTISLNIWNFVAVSLTLDNTATYTATFYIGSNSESIVASSVGWLDDSSTSTTLTIGSKNPSLVDPYTGFLYVLSIYNSDNQAFVAFFTGSTAPPNCNINQYYSGGSCHSCNAACTQGCVRNDVSCNLCYVEQCKTCQDFTSSCQTCITNASGAPTCACSLTYYWNSLTETCDSCTSNCDSCTNPSVNACTLCSNGYFLCQSLCVSTCPTGYTANTGPRTCTVSNNLALLMQPWNIQDVVIDTSNSFPVTTGPDSNFYPNYRTGDPYATRYRGYYFSGNAYMQAPPNYASSSYLVVSSQFTVTLWINPSANSGCIFSKQLASDLSIISVCLASSNVFFSVSVNSNTYSLTGTSVVLNSWNFVEVQGFLSATPSYKISVLVNTQLTNSTDLVPGFVIDGSSYLTFGASRASGTFSSFYTGFIYEIRIYNDLVQSSLILSTSCTGGCNVCPLSTNACINNCQLNSYWTGSACTLCKATCSSLGCVRFDTACNLCSDVLCSVCQDYASTCTTCKTGASLVSNVCTCGVGYAYNSVTSVCGQCPTGCSACTVVNPVSCSGCSSGYYLIDNSCLTYCPTGYSISGNVCVLDSSSGFVYAIQLTSIVDTVVDTQKNYKTTTGADSGFYPNYGTFDPMASPRGYYFTGYSYMSLPPNYADSSFSLVFAPVFTVSTWIRYTASGTILSKTSNSSPYSTAFQIMLTGSNPTILILANNQGTSTTSALTCSTSLTTANWHQVAFEITLNSGIFVNCVIDGTHEGAALVGYYLLIDFTSNFQVTIGALSGASFSSFYTGYLYSLKIWNINTNPASVDTGSCSGCSVCPPSGCIVNCGIDSYWNGFSCQACNSNCASLGCVRSDLVCNLCANQLCLVCADFTTTTSGAGSCIANASPSPCACNPGYYFDTITDTCTQCPSVCSACTSSSLIGCSSCTGNTYSLFGLCRFVCPSGYNINANSCVAGTTLIMQYLFNKIQGIVTDTSPLAASATTGSSSAFYPNYDSNDPVAAFNRGYYFNGASSVINLPPYGVYTTPIFYLSPCVTVDAWINPSSGTGTILSKQDITNFSAIYILDLLAGNLRLTAYYGGLSVTTTVCPLALGLSSWSYVGFSINYSSGTSVLTCYINSVASSALNIGAGYVDDTFTSYKVIIGATYVSSTVLSSYYTGFIYYISVDNSVKVPSFYTTTCDNGCSFCPSGHCLANCPIAQYWTGPNYNQCSNCNSNCTALGCVNSGVSCTLCSDVICNVCSDYVSGTCSACKANANNVVGCTCNNGFYWNSASQYCQGCHFTCATCNVYGFMNCLTCTSGYVLLNGACHPYCPTGTTPNGSGGCTVVNSMAFRINPLKIEGVVYDSVGNVPVVTGSTSAFYPNLESNDPFPLQGRGYYFAGTSLMKLPPTIQFNSPIFYFGNTFMVTAWISHINDGTLISTQSSSFVDSLNIRLSSQPVLSIILQDSGSVFTYTCQNTLSVYWNFVAFTVALQPSGITQVSCTVNTVTDSPFTLSNGYYLGSTSYFTIGSRLASPSTFNQYWTGVLYSLSFYSVASTLTETTNVCVTSPFFCTLCPSTTGQCINKCAYNTYWTGTACQTCAAGCNSCVTNDPKCNLCYQQTCSVCADYITGVCSQCIPNAILSSGSCACNQYYFWDSTNEICSSCNSKCNTCAGNNYLDCTSCIAGNYWFYQMCLSTCPSGYTANTQTLNCDMNYQNVLALNFDTISGNLVDSSTSAIQTRAGSTTAFYPSYDSDDPYASFMRGYYFTGSSKVYMPPYPGNTIPLLVLAPDITITFWVRPVTGGSIIYHQYNAVGVSIIFGVQILNNKVSLSINLQNSGIVSVNSGSTVTMNTWVHAAFTVSVTQSVGTQIISYLNLVQKQTQSYSYDYFPAPTNNFLWIIGTRYSTITTFSSFYTGFLYNLYIWNAVIPSSGWSTTSTCTANPTACSVCPTNGLCLPDCSISQYYDPVNQVCGPCKATCTTGCRNATYCNLCYDPICSSCSSFLANSCTNCKANSAVSGSSCACNSLYVWYGVQETCSMCYTGCSLCTTPIHNDCTLCSSNYYLTYNECLNFCPFSFAPDNSTRTCTSSGITKVFQLDLASIIMGQVTDSINSFTVLAGSSLSYYPTYNINAPLAADVRGYYFTGASYMNIQSSPAGLLNFPSRFSIGIWANCKVNSGVLVSKQFISNPSVVAFEFGLLSAKMYTKFYMTTGTFSMNSLITVNINSWNYLSFGLTVLANASSQVTFMQNGVSDVPMVLALDYFMDLGSSFTFLIGGKYTSLSVVGSYFSGFIWRVSMWQDLVTDFSSEFSTSCSGCSVCTSTSLCLSTCASTTFTPSCGACQSCAGTITCVSSSTCNLCFDLKCYICQNYTVSGCTQCKTYASFVSGIGSACACNSGYSWDSANEVCAVCANLCAPCYNLQTTGCTGCIPSAYWHDSVCMPWCPTGFIASGSTCSGTTGLVFQIDLTKILGIVIDSVTQTIQLVTGSSSAFYPNYQNNDPFAAQGRGYYFNGVSSVMNFVYNSNNNQQMVFSPQSSVGLWIFPQAFSATLISKKTNTLSQYLLFNIDSNGHPHVSFRFKLLTTLYNYTSAQTVTLNSWNYIGYSLAIINNNTQVLISLNTVNDSPFILAAGHYEDLISSYLFTLGADYLTTTTLTNYFTGYIYEVKIWSMTYNFAQEIGNCTTCYCPSSTDTCLSTCAFNQYTDVLGCSNCSSSCSTSCVRGSDCNLCYNTLCLNCKDFTALGCTTCKPNSSLLPSGACQCNTGTYFDSPSETCLSCFGYCSQCTSGLNGACTACGTLSYMNPEGGLCLSSCPVGYSIVGNVCSAVSANSLAVLFIFNMLTNEVADSSGIHWAYMGSSSNYLGNFDPNDPYPIYERGVYFFGNQYIVMPPNNKDTSSIILGNSHSVTMWVRPQSNTNNNYFMSKEDGTYLRASYYIDSVTLKTFAVYRVFSDSTNSPSVITAIGPSVPVLDNWYEISVVLSRTGFTTEVVVYLNGVSGLVSSLPDTFFQDVTSNTFKLGYSQVQHMYMKGFIYEIRIYNYAKTISAPSTACGCGGCTVDGTCLLTCGYLSYYDGACKSCASVCTTGCVNGVNCNLNLDNLCSTATGFAVSQCTSCIALASGAGNGCQCSINSAFNLTTDTCQCNSGYSLFQNGCVPCYYPLQSTDIFGYFSQDYLSLIFNSSIPVQGTISSICSKLFDSASVLMFGNSPQCSWTSDRKSLIVVLGQDATVTQSPITFQANTLYTNAYVCGVSPNSITLNIQYLYPKPTIVPIAWLLAPLQTFIQCDDLLLDASKSSNGYNRPLAFSWIFVSNPQIPALSGFSTPNITNSQLFFSKSSLSPSSVALTLVVTNWLGFSASISQNFQISAGKGLHLLIDGNTRWVMTTQDSKTIFIQVVSSCVYSTSQSFSWSIYSINGTYAAVDYTNLWKDQSSPSTIFIPPNVFKPGQYTFQVNVTDNAYGISGSTQFTITIIIQELVVILPSTYMTCAVTNKLIISGQQSYDPDKLPGNLQYFWSCTVNSQNCTGLILDPSSSILTINSGLTAGNEYEFNLTITKDSRISSDFITVQAVNFDVPSVSFDMSSSYVNPQLPLTITATVVGTGNYSYLWSLDSGGSYSLLTTLTSSQIGFKANSLTEGTNYVFRFEVISMNEVSVFKVSFNVISLPSGGNLVVSPNIGTELSTVFEFNANNWIDPMSPDTGILTYSFGYNLNNQAILLNSRNQSAFYFTELPYSSSPLVVWVKVMNSYGGYSLSTTTVSIIKNNSPDLSTPALTALTKSLSNQLTDPSILPGLIASTALYYLTNSSISDTDLNTAYQSTLAAVDKIIDTTTNFQSQDINNILSTMVVITNAYTPQVPDGIVSRVYQMLTLTSTAGISIDTTQVGYYTTMLQNAIGFNNTSIYLSPSSVSTLNTHLKNVLIAAGTTMVNTQNIFYQTSDIHISSTYYTSNTFSGYTSPIIPGYLGSITLPKIASVVTSNPVLSIFILYDDKGASLQRNSSLPSSLDFSLVAITSTGNQTISMDLTTPLTVMLPIYNYSSGTIECAYMASNWSSYGCNYNSINNGVVNCTCNHTSLFAAGVNLVPYIPPPPPPPAPKVIDRTTLLVMFYYMCGLLGLWIIISAIFLIVDQNELVERKKAEALANERFAKWYRTEDIVQKIQPEKKTNETLTVDQNPTFFRKNNVVPDILNVSELKDDSDMIFKRSHNVSMNVSNNREENPFLQNKIIDTVEGTPRLANFGVITGAKRTTEESDLRLLTPSSNPFSVNYFVSYLFIYEPYYSRFIRCLSFFTSLSLENGLIGLVIYVYPSILNLPDDENFNVGYQDINYFGILLAVIVAIISNVISFLLNLLMKNNVMIYSPGQAAGSLKSRNKIWRIFGIITCLGIMAFVVFGVYFIGNIVYTPHSIIWFYLAIIAVIFDLLVIQSLKMIIVWIKNRGKMKVTIEPDNDGK